MKKKVVNYIDICLYCHKVKDQHIHTLGFLQSFLNPEWKWEVMTIYFLTKFPKMVKQYEYIMVGVDKLTKDTHFVSLNITHKEANIENICMR